MIAERPPATMPRPSKPKNVPEVSMAQCADSPRTAKESEMTMAMLKRPYQREGQTVGICRACIPKIPLRTRTNGLSIVATTGGWKYGGVASRLGN